MLRTLGPIIGVQINKWLKVLNVQRKVESICYLTGKQAHSQHPKRV